MKKKNLLLIANYWHFEEEKSSSRYRSFADLLSAKYNLEVITSTFCHLQKAQRDISRLNFSRLPYKMTLIYERGYSKNIGVERILSYQQFGKNVLNYIQKLTDVDLILVSVPSLTVADCVTRYAKEKSIPVIVDIQDLWPEAFKMAFNVPILSDILFFPMLKQANRIYRRADYILAVSDTYVRRAMVTGNNRGESIYIGTDSELVRKKIQNIEVHKDFNEFWIGYVGALGHSYDIKSVIDALAILKKQGIENIVFKVMGDGVLKTEFENYAKSKNVRCDFMGLLEYGLMMKTLMACDVAVNPIVKQSVSSIINKVSDYAAAKIPVINTQTSKEYRNLLERYNAGVNVENGDIDAMSDAIRELYFDHKKKELMGKNASRMFSEKFDRQVNYPRIIPIIEKLLKNA